MTKSAKDLKSATDYMTSKGQRWTETRAHIYEVMLENKSPLTAYELLEKVAKRYKKSVKPTSIYRTLEAFCKTGLAVRIESLSAFALCRHPEHPHQHIVLICQECGQTKIIDDQIIGKKVINEATAHGFLPERQVLEVYGSCKECRT